MLRIGQVEPSATADGKYTDGSVAGGIAATRLRAAAFNAMQEELANIVESAGMILSPDDMTQVLTALKKQLLSRANPFADIKADGPAAVAAALSNLGLADANGAVGRLLNVVKFTGSGTYTPTHGTKSIIVEAIGGGGASGNLTATGPGQNAISAAGSNGAYAKARYTSEFSSVNVTIGAGGTINGGGGGNGGNGGNTVFGSLLTCPGGKGSGVGQANVPPFNNGAALPSEPPSGSGIIVSTRGPYSSWPTVVAAGNGSNFANSISSPLGQYGLGGDGVASDTSQAAKNGITGSTGYVIIWEYA